jgi:hypothetical protein
VTKQRFIYGEKWIAIATSAKWSSRIETAHHFRCGNHKQGHAEESPDRNGLSDWRVPCDTGFPHWCFKVTYQNFKSFPNCWCISRDCRLTGYLIINVWKCYLLFKLPCICATCFRKQ